MSVPVELKTAAEISRERLLLAVQAAFVLAVASIFFLVFTFLLNRHFPEFSAKLVAWFAGMVPFATGVDAVSGPGTAAEIVAKLPGLCAALVGAFLAWKTRGTVRHLAEALIPFRDSRLLRPIQRAGALDPLWAPANPDSEVSANPFAWVEPPPPAHSEDAPTPRRHVWNRLLAFLSDDVGDGRFGLLGQPRAEQTPFRWIVLTGHAGSGKTRMALEVARARARRDVLGDSQAITTPEERRARRRAGRNLLVGAWWRLVIPWKRRREGGSGSKASPHAPWHGSDHWDAWWLVAAGGPERPAHGGRPSFDPGLLDRLKKWRPYRPTVLVLDDPLQGDAERVVLTLLDAERFYRHPVRLLIVNQTIPSDLKIRDQGRSWRSDLRCFAGEVLKLGPEAALGPAEVRIMEVSLRLAWFKERPGARRPVTWKSDDASVKRLLRRTGGNALLVGLALYHLYRHPNRPEVSRETLLRERAEQIVTALEAAGIGIERTLAIAQATLAGPEALVPAPLLGRTRFDPELLGLVPNLFHRESPAAPLVQPELIGDAFVRYVLDDRRCAPDRRREIVAAAWRAAPAAMLRTAWRLSSVEDVLAQTLRRGPPPEAGLDELTTALAYGRWAVQIPRLDWDLGDVPGPAPLPPLPGGYVEVSGDDEEEQRFAGLRVRSSVALRVAQDRLRALPPALGSQALSEFLALLTVASQDAIVMGDAALACLTALAGSALQDEGGAAIVRADCLIQWFVVLKGKVTLRRPDQAFTDVAELVRHLAPAFGSDPESIRRADALARAASQLPSAYGGLVLDALAATVQPNGAFGAVRAHRLAARAAALRGKPDSAEAAARHVEDLARPFLGDRDFELERAQAWRYVGRTRLNDAAGCEAAARHVEDLARPFPGDRDLELQRAEAWRTVGYARRNDAASCEAAARHIDDLARPFPGDRDLELQRAEAWRYVGHARQNDAAGCEAAARHVDDLARPFPSDRDFELQRALAWGSMAYARQNDAASCEAAARHVDDLARPFPGDRDFELKRALAWRYVGYTRGNDAADCEAAARHVDELARPFPGDRDFELERAQAWGYVGRTRLNDAAGCEAAARHVDDLARPFPGDRDFELERAMAWGSVAYARRNDAAGCEAAAQHVDDLARPFPCDRVFQLERARPWGYVGYARRNDAAGSEAAARHFDDLARPFPGDRDFELERVRAWGYLQRGLPPLQSDDTAVRTNDSETQTPLEFRPYWAKG